MSDAEFVVEKNRWEEEKKVVDAALALGGQVLDTRQPAGFATRHPVRTGRTDASPTKDGAVVTPRRNR